MAHEDDNLQPVARSCNVVQDMALCSREDSSWVARATACTLVWLHANT
jgi:hypothetical protein